MELVEYIKSDLARRATPTIKGFIKTYFSLNGEYFRFQVWLRIVHFSKKKTWSKMLIYPIAYIRYHGLEYKYGVFVNTNIHIGKGLKIVHGGGVGVNCSEIGENFTCYQGVTIGRKHEKYDVPAIKNNVTVFPHAVICGDIKIEDGTIVGANAYLGKSTLPNTRVLGPKSVIIEDNRNVSMNEDTLC